MAGSPTQPCAAAAKQRPRPASACRHHHPSCPRLASSARPAGPGGAGQGPAAHPPGGQLGALGLQQRAARLARHRGGGRGGGGAAARARHLARHHRQPRAQGAGAAVSGAPTVCHSSGAMTAACSCRTAAGAGERCTTTTVPGSQGMLASNCRGAQALWLVCPSTPSSRVGLLSGQLPAPARRAPLPQRPRRHGDRAHPGSRLGLAGCIQHHPAAAGHEAAANVGWPTLPG